MKNGKAYLTLQNGKQFVGNRFGAEGDVISKRLRIPAIMVR